MLKRRLFLTITLTLLLALSLSSAVLASTLPNSVDWDRQGSDSLRCDKLGESPERTEDGWIHWIVTQASGVTEAELKLGGSGSGTYAPTKYGPVLEFFTPYFDVDALTATLHYAGTLGSNSQFTISDYCPGVDNEELTVTKTVDTSFTREHFWDIAKKVETENGYKHEGYPKIWLFVDGSGDEKATWTVDVTYKGYEDGEHNVSGDITIENTGSLDAVITAVDDVLAGTLIDVDCGVTFPYTLPAGETLVCTYSEDGYVEGSNVVTVTTERDEYTAEEPISWGDPDPEINKTVNVKDISDLFGDVDLGTVTAPNGDTFTYHKDFAWADYGAEGCGDFVYENTATIVETEQSASATLKVNVQCFVYETAYAKGGNAICFIPTFRNWGWTNPIGPGPGNYIWPLYAAAGQCDTSKGTEVGSVTVKYGADGNVTVTYNVVSPYSLKETHVYVGVNKFPKDARGRDTVAPGQYTNNGPFDGSQVYVIAHAVVGLPDPNFGPSNTLNTQGADLVSTDILFLPFVRR